MATGLPAVLGRQETRPEPLRPDLSCGIITGLPARGIITGLSARGTIAGLPTRGMATGLPAVLGRQETRPEPSARTLISSSSFACPWPSTENLRTLSAPAGKTRAPGIAAALLSGSYGAQLDSAVVITLESLPPMFASPSFAAKSSPLLLE